MIDNRHKKVFDFEKDEALQELSDTSILLNFQQALVSLYPHLIPIQAYVDDAFEEIVIPLFYEMVYKTFAYKYGINLNDKVIHEYMLNLGTYKRINHIECIPKHNSFKVLVNWEWIDMDKNDLEEKILVFKSFGDGKHCLTTGMNFGDPYTVMFNLVEVDIISKLTGNPTISNAFINKDDLDFEFVAEI